MKTPTELFKEYVTLVGGAEQAASRLGITVGMVNHIRNERRNVSPAVAKKIELQTDGQFTRADLRPDVFGPAPAQQGEAA